MRELADKVTDVHAMRAIGFCVGVRHAEYMAQAFNNAGIPALAVTGQTPADEREAAIAKLHNREVNILFTADLFNEGVDIPSVDTVLFLRPTESATIFLQQLGRGLRRTDDKAVLTALDFVGHQRKEFRFDLRLRALTGSGRKRLARDVETDFPYLPAGCQIVLDKQTQRAVLENLKSQISSRWSEIVNELRRIGDVSLEEFLTTAELELADIIKNHSWTKARRAAGFPLPAPGPNEEKLLKRVSRFAMVDDSRRAALYLDLLSDDAPDYRELSAPEQTLARMFFFNLWPDRGGFRDYATGLASLRNEPAFRTELSEVIQLAFDRSRHRPRRLNGNVGMTPLASHAHYTREELAAALGYATWDRSPGTLRQGVFYSDQWATDAFMVTLNKSDDEFSPTTMYQDYPLSRDLFHWESQSGTTIASATGQRYIRQSQKKSQVLLFVRENRSNAFGKGAAYMLLGTANYVSHRGERPIAITYKLDREMPASVYAYARTS